MDTIEVAKLFSREKPFHASLEYQVESPQAALKLADRLGQHWALLGDGLCEAGESSTAMVWEYPKLIVVVSYPKESYDKNHF